MLLKRTIHKTKNYIHKTLVNLKYLFSGGFQKRPKLHYLNPFSCSKGKPQRHCPRDHFYDFYDEWESSLDRETKRINDSTIISESSVKQNNAKKSPVKKRQELGAKEKKKTESESRCKNMDRRSKVLAKKMKEIEMADGSDVEQVLDIEEALHYYSRLRSPVYLDIVDKFFMDMYSEFPVQEAPSVTVSKHNSKKRSGSFRTSACRMLS